MKLKSFEAVGTSEKALNKKYRIAE